MTTLNRIALFDFCETLASFQTADAYVHFVRDKMNLKTMKNKECFRLLLEKTKVLFLLEKMSFVGSINKRLVLWQLKNIDYKTLDCYANEYYHEYVRPRLITPVIEKMISLQKEGIKCYLLSAGYDIYLKYFIQDFKLNGCICTKIAFKNEICLGYYEAKDCYGQEKVLMFKEYFHTTSLLDESYAFSDSKSDIPMLQLCKHRIAVCNSKNDVNKKWIKKHCTEVIIWNG